MKKIQTLEDTIESLRQQLVFTRSEEEQISNAISNKKPKQPKETKPKQPKETKAKEPKAATEEKEKIPMPWTGLADFATCVGLKAQYGLFIQCGKACDATSASFQIDNHECRFCNECAKKCDENGKHPVGTIEERIEAGVGKYVNAKTGKKETAYIEVLEKMGITKEQALESAQRRGFQIPDWMLEKTEKKRGRPGKNTENVASESVVEKQEKQEKQEKPKKEPKQKQPPRSKKTASVATFDTPQKVSTTTKDSAQSSVCIDLNDVATVAVVASVDVVAPQEKKKRGRPTKSNTENNVDVDEMQQLIIQATTEKKKRLSLDAEVMPSDESEQSLHPETQLIFNGEENKSKSEDVESDEVFEMFDEMIRSEEQEQQVAKEAVKEVVKEDVKEPAKKKKGSEEAAAAKEAAKEAAKKKKEEEAAAKEAAKEAAKKKKEEEAAAKEAVKEAAKKKKEEEAAAKEAAKKKKESEEAAKKKQEEEAEETEDEEDGDDEEEDEELECEEYEYEGETYGLAPNGDIYSQDGELVGRMNNGIPKMFD
jgi:hypothetical protein